MLAQSQRASRRPSLRILSPRCRRSYATPAQLAQKTDPNLIPPYEKLVTQLQTVRSIVNRPLSLAEKILYSHLHDVEQTFADGADKIRAHKVGGLPW